MKVLVTGGGGFIGSHCLPRLVDAGFDVCAVSSRDRQGSGVEWRRFDLLADHRFDELIESVRPTHLLHLAWMTTPGEYWTSPHNLTWTASSLELIRAFREGGGQRVVAAGTCAEYSWDHQPCVEEEAPLAPRTLYGSCKRSLQALLSGFASQTGLSAAWGRIFFLYGPREGPGRLVPTVIRALLTNQPARCSAGNQRRDFLYVEDVADAFVTLLRSDVQGPVNLASGVSVAVRDVVLQIADLIGAPQLVHFGEARPEEPPLIVADTTRLNTVLGWTPQFSLTAGLETTIDWWREHLR